MRYFGERMKRVEDPPLLRGGARFVDDIPIPGVLHAAFVRSPHPHAAIAAIDATAAREIEGIHAIFTQADFSPHLTQDRLPLGFRDDRLPKNVTQCVLAGDEVCYVGETVAVVVADSRYAAEDAAELVDIEYEILGSVSDCRAAIAPDAPRVRGRSGTNILLEFAQDYGDADAAFTQAPHVFKTELLQHRGGAHPMEGRGALARFDAAEEKLTLWTSTQMSHEVRSSLVILLALDESRLRVIAPAVGGGFGCKYLMYSEEVVVCLAARLTGRPVKWIEDRREHFLASVQERDQYWDVEIATDDDGMILAVRGQMIHDQGAYTPQGVNLPFNASTAVPGPYIVPNYHLKVIVAETNLVPAMPVRGAGYPEGCFTMERLLDRAAIGLGMDRAEIRRRNLVPPEKMPYEIPLKTRAGTPIKCDSGDFPMCQKLALEKLDYAGFKERRDDARNKGRYLGIGLSNGLKGTGRGPFESGTVRIERSGQVSVFTGALAMGQGLATALAQICAEQLGLDINDINVVAGDTAAIALGQGGFGSRQSVTAGSSVHISATEVRNKVLKLAAHMLEAAEVDLELIDGDVRVKGAPGLAVSLKRVAEVAAGVPGYSLPAGIEPGMEASANFAPTALTYSNGVHAVEVEVDIETGKVTILRYVALSDSGNLINPMMVDGQIQGGVVHGIGNGLFEHMRFDEQGQPLTTNLADYLLPTATEVPNIEIIHHVSPSPLNPLGVKGVGECGTIPAAAAIISAVENALEPFGICIEEAPIMPMRIVELIAEAKNASA